MRARYGPLPRPKTYWFLNNRVGFAKHKNMSGVLKTVWQNAVREIEYVLVLNYLGDLQNAKNIFRAIYFAKLRSGKKAKNWFLKGWSGFAKHKNMSGVLSPFGKMPSVKAKMGWF